MSEAIRDVGPDGGFVVVLRNSANEPGAQIQTVTLGITVSYVPGGGEGRKRP